MKLSNKEKIFLAIFLAIVILVAGAFVLVMPEFNKIDTNKKALQAAKDQRDSLYNTLSRESTIDSEIQAAFDQANKFAPYFYEDMTVLDADELTRQILKDTNMTTKGLNINDFTTSTLTVSQYVDTVVTYPLKEYSGYTPDRGIDFSQYSISYDENGEIVVPEELKDVLKEYLNTILSTQQQTIGSISVGFTIEGTRGDFLKFLDHIADLEKATYIPSIIIDYTKTTANQPVNPNPDDDEENNDDEPQQPAQGDQELDDDDPVSVSIQLIYYCVMPMQTESDTTAPEAEPAE